MAAPERARRRPRGARPLRPGARLRHCRRACRVLSAREGPHQPRKPEAAHCEQPRGEARRQVQGVHRPDQPQSRSQRHRAAFRRHPDQRSRRPHSRRRARRTCRARPSVAARPRRESAAARTRRPRAQAARSPRRHAHRRRGAFDGSRDHRDPRLAARAGRRFERRPRNPGSRRDRRNGGLKPGPRPCLAGQRPSRSRERSARHHHGLRGVHGRLRQERGRRYVLRVGARSLGPAQRRRQGAWRRRPLDLDRREGSKLRRFPSVRFAQVAGRNGHARVVQVRREAYAGRRDEVAGGRVRSGGGLFPLRRSRRRADAG